MHIHQVPHFDADPSSTLSRTPSIFSTESKHRPAPPHRSYLLRSFGLVPSPGFAPSNFRLTLPRHSHESYAIWSPANIFIGSEQKAEQQRDTSNVRKFRSAGIFPGICSPSRFRQRLNFPAPARKFWRECRKRPHIFSRPFDMSDCIFVVADGDSFDTSFIEVPKAGSRRQKSVTLRLRLLDVIWDIPL